MPDRAYSPYLLSRPVEANPSPTLDVVPLVKADGTVKIVRVSTLTGRVIGGGGDPVPVDSGVVDFTDFDGNDAVIDDTAAITSFIVPTGTAIKITFLDSLLITYDASDLPIQGGKDITTKAGDIAIVVGGLGDVGYVEQFIPYVPPNTIGVGIAQGKATDTQVQFGDIDAAGNETVIIIDDVAHTVQIKSNNLFAALGASILLGGITQQIALFCKALVLDCQDGAAVFGDNAAAGNGTVIRLDDPTSAITLHADAGVTIENVLALTPVAFTALPASPTFGMIAAVNDAASSAAWGDVVNAGGSSKNIIVYYDGVSDWRIMGGF
jgi:hypothetical protein